MKRKAGLLFLAVVLFACGKSPDKKIVTELDAFKA